MSRTKRARSRMVRPTVPIAVVGVMALGVTACGSGGSTSRVQNAPAQSSAAPPTTTVGSSPTASANSSDPALTVRVATVAGVGRILVNGNGRTMYVLASEKGGKVTCTATGGCTKYWPAVVLPPGVTHGTAGEGVQASSLGSVSSPSGEVRLTYAGWPLYTYVGDSRAGQAAGQGVKDSFGIWWVLSPAGTPVTGGTSSVAPAPSTPASTAAPSSGGAGF